MKRSNGFTLIELLAVLIIISIILLLIGPQILGRISSSKETLYETQLEEVKKAARVYMSKLNFDIGTLPEQTITITLGELKKEGLVEKDIKNPKSGKLLDDCIEVTITKKGENNYSYVVNDNPTNTNCKSNEYYSIILVGNSNVKVQKNTPYKDDGVILKGDKGTIIDPKDVEVKIYRNGILYKDNLKYSNFEAEIDTSNIYTYTIKYTYEDTFVTRNIEIVNNVTNNTNFTKPTFEIYPTSWSIAKTIKVNTEENGTILIKSGMNLTSTEDVNLCNLTTGSLYNCTETKTKTLMPNTWYKTNKTNVFTTIENGNIVSTITDGIKSENSSTTITKIDRTPPQNITATARIVGNKLYAEATAKDYESGIYGYQYSIDGGVTWSEDISLETKVFTITTGPKYSVLARAINNTYDGRTDGKKELIEGINQTTLTTPIVVESDNNPPVISNVTAVTLTDRIYLSFKITDDSGISSYKIEYGTNTNYGQEIDGDLKKCDASGCTINDLVIKGLKANQTYYYRISATDLSGNEATPVINNITTKTIKEPTYIISPNNWSREKKIDITYSTENIENPKYYFYTNDVGTTDKTVKKCDNTRTNCATQTTTLEKNTWYLIPDNTIQIKYATEGNKTINTLTLDESSNDKALNNITITKIDRTAPVINNIDESVNSVSANIAYNITDLQADGITPGSGLTLNSSNQEKTTCKYGTSSTNLNKTVEGTKTGCKIENLTGNTTYYYIIEAEDKAGNKGNSGEVKSFTTTNTTTLDCRKKTTDAYGNETVVTETDAYGNIIEVDLGICTGPYGEEICCEDTTTESGGEEGSEGECTTVTQTHTCQLDVDKWGTYTVECCDGFNSTCHAAGGCS